jgi:hypothetical protein
MTLQVRLTRQTLMAHLYRSVATLRVSGEDLDPDEITALLGCAPTTSERKGDVLTSKTTGRSRTLKFGVWRLDAADREPEDLDGQIAELLGKLTSSMDAWHSIAERYAVDLFCGFFMRETNEGLEISPASLAALGQREIVLGLDIYAPTREDLERARSTDDQDQ